MPRFFVKKTTLSDDGKSVVFKGSVLEGPIHKGMTVEIPVTEAASIRMKLFDVVHFESQKDPAKKVGLVVDFDTEPEAMDIVLGLNIAEETLNLVP
ncbi:MAG TPA: hypothetical protein VLM37_05320 [Fibrobacteraceae bacterium]|nr:hypothetical protein [Fibrobacteraceae bacterium]